MLLEMDSLCAETDHLIDTGQQLMRFCSQDSVTAQILNERCAGGLVLDEDLVRMMFAEEIERGLLQFGIPDSLPPDVEQIKEAVVHSPGRANAVVVQFATFACRIPTLKNEAELLWSFFRAVRAEPLRLDQVAFDRDWILLVLALKVKFANRLFDLSQH
jgi:hypothetical protein